MRDIKEVFWTGGWDSTFRMVQLSRQDLVIQPVYIGGDNRPSERIELATMNTISALLTQHQGTKAKILPLKIVQKEDIPPNAEITEAFYEIRKSIPIGTQYEYLARYAKLNPYVEIGPECPDGEYSGIVEAINAYGELIQFGDSWVLNKEKSTEQCMLLFGNFSYPIIKTTERQMRSMIVQWGYEDVMEHIWFCHNPIHNKPCGLCRPCEQKIEENMDFLVDCRGKKRYRTAKRFEKLFGKRGRYFVERIYRKLNF